MLALVLCGGLTVAAYGSSVGAGFMFDAAIDLPRASDRSWLEVLTSAGASPYFRPVTLLIWKALHMAFGRNDEVALHALSLASHILCGWLVYQVVVRLLDRWAGLAAAALFTLFPLSYQVVAFVDSVFHSLATMLALTAVVLYLDWRRLGGLWRLGVALASAGLALFTHESAIALVAIAPALEVLILHQPISFGRTPQTADGLKAHSGWHWNQALLGVGGVYAVAGFFGLFWLVVPRWPSSVRLNATDIRLNGLYFAQGLAAPVAMVFGHFGLTLVCGLTASGLLGVCALRGRLRVGVFGLVWFAAATLPACLALPWPNYVIDAPRLLYLAAPGIALLWAAALTPASWATALGGAAIVAVLGQGWLFVAERERFVEQGGAVVQQLVDTARAGGRVYVNVPAFVGPQTEELPLGHYGVTMLPDYFGLDVAVAAATGQHWPIQSVTYDDLLRPWDAAYAPQAKRTDLAGVEAAIRQGGGVYVAQFLPRHVQLAYAGELTSNNAAAPQAHFGWTELLAATATQNGQTVTLDLTWRAVAPAPADFTVFVHAVGADGSLAAQADGYPISGLYPPNAWRAGDVIEDHRALDVTGTATHIEIGLYDRADPNTRAPATDGSGQPLRDNAYRITL
ncbi:MAG: glycosyltransferase family 39 protein [Chloroflexi bacterium]|nr:glycosyltransferase family 39 protein [Chloroflexota bacterium]